MPWQVFARFCPGGCLDPQEIPAGTLRQLYGADVRRGNFQELPVEAVSGETLAWMLTYAGSVVLVTVNLRNEPALGLIRLPTIVGAGRSITLKNLHTVAFY